MTIRSLLTRAPLAILAAGGLFFATHRLLAPHDACGTGEGSACAAPELAAPAAPVEVPRGQPRLIEFGSAHCAACKRMAPIVKELEERCARGKDAILRVEIDDAHGEALASRYGVRMLPTFLGVDAAGEEVERVVGEQPRERIASLLGDVRGEVCPAL